MSSQDSMSKGLNVTSAETNALFGSLKSDVPFYLFAAFGFISLVVFGLIYFDPDHSKYYTWGHIAVNLLVIGASVYFIANPTKIPSFIADQRATDERLRLVKTQPGKG